MTSSPEPYDHDIYLAETLPLPAIDVARYEPTPIGLAKEAAPSRDRTGLARIARGSQLNLIGAAVAVGGTIGLTVVVTHRFPKPAAGAFFVAMSLFLISESVANLGAYNGAIYFIARLRALHADRRIPAILRATIVPVIFASIAGTVALLIFAVPFARFLLSDRVQTGVSVQETAFALRGFAIALPFAALADTLLGATRGYREMRPTVITDRIGRSGLQVIGVVLAAVLGKSLLLAPLWAIAYLPVSVAAAIWLRRVVQSHRPALVFVRPPDPTVDNRHGKPNAKGFWRFTGPRSVASIAQMIIQRLDIVLVGLMRGPVDAAIYTAATRFLVIGQFGNSAISTAAQPQFTHLFTVRDRLGANAVYQTTTAWLILLTWPMYLIAIIFGPSVLSIFGHSYLAGHTVMIILGFSMLVATACGQVDMVLTTTGRSSWSLANGLAAMTVNIGVDLLLIPRYGITGAAIGWAAAIAIANLVPLAQVAIAVKIHPFGRGTLLAFLLTTTGFGVIPELVRIAFGTSVGAATSSLAAGCLAMVAGLWWLRGTFQLSLLSRSRSR